MPTTWTRQAINATNEATSTSSPSTEWSRIQIVSSAGGGNLTINGVDYITDSTGTGSLLNIDALDATTEATIESAIDTLTNLTIQTSLNVVGTANLDAVDIDGNVQLDGTLTVGVDGTSYDVKFFGDDPGNFMLWDQSNDRLEIRNDYARAGLLLSNTLSGSSTNSPAIDYYRNNSNAAASDVLGITTYKGRNHADDADVIYARLQSSILDPTKGGEEGQFKLGVMANGVFRQNGITIAGQSDGTVDVTLGNSTAATTNIAGDLTILGGNITNAITFDAGISNAGTITGGTWNGTAIADSYISSASTWNAKQNALTFGISNTNAVKIDAADVADDDYARFTANGLEGRTLAEIKSDIGTGNSALVPAAGSSGHFLAHNGAFAQVAYSNISGTPTIPTNYVTNDASDSMLGSLTTVGNMAGTTTSTDSSFTADINQGGNTAGGQTRTAIGFKADYDYTGTNSTGATTTFEGLRVEANTPSCNSSNINNSGVVSVLTGDNSGSGAVRQTGVDLTITGGDTANQTGLLVNTDDGSTDIKIVSSADTGDYFSIATTTHGATTITTVDDDAAAAHLNIEPDGHVEFDGCGVGFDRILAEDAADVTIDFRTGNKAHLDMTGGNITGTLTLQFPAVSGNFVLVVQQDGSTRTINAYATKDAAGNAGNNDGGTGGAIRWAGGSVPDLTDGGNKRDVLSFYWDADEEVCYGVASLNF